MKDLKENWPEVVSLTLIGLAIVGFILLIIFGRHEQAYSCPDNQHVLYRHELVGKVWEYIPIGCEQ